MMSPRAPITTEDTTWWVQSRCRIFYDAHTPDLADPHQLGTFTDTRFPILSEVDPEGDLQLMADAGADSAVLFAKCQYGNSYHPTSVGRQHSALKGRDLFGEQLRAAHRRGIRVIAYFSNMWDVAAAGANPDWVLEPSPARPNTGRWPALCLLSGYRQYALEQVREIARLHPIDALWSDILTAGPCVCDRCEGAFREQYGKPMPNGRDDPSWVDLIRFSQQLTLNYLEEQRAVLKQERPHAALIPNFYATPFVDPVTGLRTDHLELADIGSTEGYTDWHDLGFPSFASTYIRAGVLGGPSEVLTSRFVHTWDFTIRSVAQLRFESFTVSAHGSTVSLDDQPYPSGAIEPEVYRRMEPVFSRIKERAPWTVDALPVPFAALYVSETSRRLESLLGGPENPSVGEQSAQFPPSETHSYRSDLDGAVSGTYRACIESHIPVEMVDGRESALAQLGAFKVVILADVMALSAGEAKALEDFVRSGGGLVVSGECGVLNESGAELIQPGIRNLLGADFGKLAGFPYPFISPGADLSSTLGSWPIPHYGRVRQLLDVSPDAKVLATKTDPILRTDGLTFWHNNQPGPGRQSSDPIIIERQVGAGRVIVSSARLGNNHARLGHAAYRSLINELVLRAADERPPVSVLGEHRNTEMILKERDGQLIVHLITGYPVARLDVHGASQPQSIEDVASVSSLVLRIPDGATDVSRIVEGAQAPLQAMANLVKLRDLDDWETVVINF